MDDFVSQMRTFNRFYTVYLGILNTPYLNNKYSLAEIRVLTAAVAKPGITPSEIVSMLNIDKSYLSRIITRLQKLKLITQKKSKTDGRSFNLYSTALGKKECLRLDNIATKSITSILKPYSDKDCARLVKSMSEIIKILSKSE